MILGIFNPSQSKPVLSDRITITNGVRPLKFLFTLFALGSLVTAFQVEEGRARPVFFFLFWTTLVILAHISRRVRFDQENLYRTYGPREKVQPFTSIIRIERSGAKLSNRRFWNVIYKTDDGRESRIRFLEGNFQHGSVNEFIKAVQAVNPEVQIERSHFWAQVGKGKKKEANQSSEARR